MSAVPPRITLLSLFLTMLRLGLMTGLLLVCLPLHYLTRLFTRRRIWPRIFLAGLGRIAGLRLTIRGPRHPRALLLANHVSWLDIPVIATAHGSAFIAHDGLASIPLIRHLCAMNDTIFVSRHSRAHVVRQAAEIRKALADTGALTLFPEGTTSDGTGLLAFKSALLGAVEPLPEAIVIQPVLLHYADAPSIAWVGEEHGVANFLRVLGRWRPVRLTVHFLPPLGGSDLDSRKTMTATAQAAIAQAMASNHG